MQRWTELVGLGRKAQGLYGAHEVKEAEADPVEVQSFLHGIDVAWKRRVSEGVEKSQRKFWKSSNPWEDKEFSQLLRTGWDAQRWYRQSMAQDTHDMHDSRPTRTPRGSDGSRY